MRFANEKGYCELNSFPGCNQIIVSNHGTVYPEHRGKGEGLRNHRLRAQRATFFGYDYLMCTVISTNTPEIKILSKQGFKKLDEFLNTESGNTVYIYGRKLKRK